MAKYNFDYYGLLNSMWKTEHTGTLYNIVKTDKKCPICGGMLYNVWSFIKPKSQNLIFHCKDNDEHEFLGASLTA